MEQFRPSLKAPGFPKKAWLNTHQPIVWDDLISKITLVDFFDFTCINCLRTLPYLRAWMERYEDHGLQLIGVHTPEFHFAHDPEAVKAGINRLGIHWPVILDNDQELWTAYANRYWPSLYIIDALGKVCFRHVGEGNYRDIEATIQDSLHLHNPDTELPELLSPLRPEDREGAVCAPTSPEIHLGSVDRLDFDQRDAQAFQLPPQREPERIYLDGRWRLTGDGITLVSKQGGIVLRYRAAQVHAVLAPDPDDRQRLPFTDEPLYIEILQDGVPLSPDRFSAECLAIGPNTLFRVDAPRLYTMIENLAVETHELQLKISRPGLTLYAFSFGSCLLRDPQPIIRAKE